MNFVGQHPFASQHKNDYPECSMCTWVYRELDGKFWLKFLNNWCFEHVQHGTVLYDSA